MDLEKIGLKFFRGDVAAGGELDAVVLTFLEPDHLTALIEAEKEAEDVFPGIKPRCDAVESPFL